MNYKETVKKRKYEIIILLCTLIYTVIFSYHTCLKHYAFKNYGWDLGVFNQVMFSSVCRGRWFYYTPDLFMNPEGNYFAIHFSPILVLLFPIYALFPFVQTLLTMKSLIIAAAALPIFYLTREMTGDERTSLFTGVAYLLHPGTQGANWFDFQPQMFIPLLTASMLLMLLRRRWKTYFLLLFLTLAIQEFVFAIIITTLLAYLMHHGVEDIRKLKEVNEASVTISSIVICLIFQYTAIRYIRSFPIDPEFVNVYKASSVFSVIGYEGDLLFLPFYMVFNLGNTFRSLVHDIYPKFMYFLFLFAPVLFLPLMNRFIVINVILFLPFFLSNYRAYYMVGSHYSLYLLPSIFISLIYTLRGKSREDGVSLASYMVVASCLMTAVLSPISGLSTIMNERGEVLWYPGPVMVTERVHSTHTIIDLIPDNASVLTQNHIFPHVSGRNNAYLLPLSDYSPNQTAALKGYVGALIERCDYVLLDVRSYDSWTAYAHGLLVSDARFGVSTFNDMVILFERGQNGLAQWDPKRMVFHAHEDLHVGPGSITADPANASRPVVSSPKGSPRGYMVYGPYTYLVDGGHRATLHVKAYGDGEGYVGTFEVTSDMGTELLARRDIYGFEFPDDEWESFDVEIFLDRPRGMVEFRLYTVGAADLLVDRIEVMRKNSTEPAPASTVTFTYRDLILPDGAVTDDGLIHHSPDGEEEGFWYGPYHHLPPGAYGATFYVKAVPQGNATGGTVILLDVCHGEGRQIIASRAVTDNELRRSEIRDGWSAVTLNFDVKPPDALLEFRGREPSPDYDIYMSVILVEPEEPP